VVLVFWGMKEEFNSVKQSSSNDGLGVSESHCRATQSACAECFAFGCQRTVYVRISNTLEALEDGNISVRVTTSLEGGADKDEPSAFYFLQSNFLTHIYFILYITCFHQADQSLLFTFQCRQQLFPLCDAWSRIKRAVCSSGAC
jgi:hypothetical protein